MKRSETIRARIDPETKGVAERVLEGMGLSISDAIRILFVRIAADRQPPFDIQNCSTLPKASEGAIERETIRARIDTDTKEAAEAILAALRLSTSDAIRTLFSRIASDGDLPFDIQACARRRRAHVEPSEGGGH